MKAGRKFRHLHRYRDIAAAFARNGFGVIVKELGLLRHIPFPRIPAEESNSHTRTTGERIRLFLQELGPTFVKLGQIASTRPDLIPAEILAELAKLQDKVPPFPFADVKKLLEAELGAPLSSLFDRFDETPIAAASIGQVHTARLHSGEQIAVKVQRPGIRAVVETDLEILQDLARAAEHRLEWASRFGIRDLVDELSVSLLAELDYTLEGRNAERIAAQFHDNSHVIIPAIYWDLTTRKVLAMDYLNGISIGERELLAASGYELRSIAESVAGAVFEQLFIGGFFHADPHPGNVIVMPPRPEKPGSGKTRENRGRSPDVRPVIGLLDFGLVGRLTPGMKGHFASLVIAMRRQSTDGVIKAIEEMGLISEMADRFKLRREVDLLREKYYQVPFSEISLSEAVNDLFSVAYRHRVKMPKDFMLLGKTLLTLEGVLTSLDPEFTVVSVAEPFGKRLLLERMQPRRLAETAAGYALEYAALLGELPSRLRGIFALMQRGKLPLELTVPDVDRIMKRLDRISGRLSFSIVLLSFSILMAGLIIGSSLGRQPDLLTRFPALEIGFSIAGLMFLYMIISIFRSGRK
ncbi:ABC1 kinase family protein [Paenibacillus beijingensis]|uniref:ABC transporter n=1 Tax=Paenibacillus beijingensis TaxID=1126833 RepID=A0A0D5NIP1_9BACL|nr:AarF/ABC1/UbiB kinase family protein [Paenibacillus beijingensis]AJY74990.1 ABC transporter [Paenibacillus beijingensis]